MSEIGERVKKIVVEHLGVEPEKVTEAASFIDDLGADSLDTVELVMAFEEEFGCEIPDDAAETILTVGDATKFLEKNAKGNPIRAEIFKKRESLSEGSGRCFRPGPHYLMQRKQVRRCYLARCEYS
jgi:acyl carrier protein